MSGYEEMAAALDAADEEAALRALEQDLELATRRFLGGERQRGHSGPLLLHAAELGMAKVVEKLLAQGIHPDTFGGGGATSLHFAASCGHLKTVQALLDAGATVDVKCSTWGNTALGWASGCDGEETLACMKLLINAGASPAIASSRGYTPLSRAYLYEQPDKVTFLESLSAPQELSPTPPQTSLRANQPVPAGLLFHLAIRDGQVVDLCGRDVQLEGDLSIIKGRQGGTALAFKNNCVRVPHDPEFNAKGGITMATWLRIPWTASDDEGDIFSKGKWERRCCPWEFAICPDWSIMFQSYGEVENEGCVSGCPRRAEWHHVAAVWDERCQQIFVDGDEKIRVRVIDELTENDVPVTIGRRADDPDCYRNPLEADLEDTMIFNRALSSEEIQIVMGA